MNTENQITKNDDENPFQGYGVHQVLDCLNCLLVFFSSVISSLLSRSWFSQNETTSQSASA
jgi:hypothetical protein